MKTLNFVPSARLTVENFVFVRNFEKYKDWGDRYYNAPGSVYRCPLSVFVAASSVAHPVDAAAAVEYAKKVFEELYDSRRCSVDFDLNGLRCGASREKVERRGLTLDDLSVFINVHDYGVEGCYNGDADGLAGVLADYNRYFDLEAAFALLPLGDVSLHEALAAAELPGVAPYLSEYGKMYVDALRRRLSGSDDVYPFRMWCRADRVAADLLAFGCKMEEKVSFYWSYRDGITFNDSIDQKIYSPSGLELSAWSRNRNTFELYPSENPLKGSGFDYVSDFDRNGDFKTSAPLNFAPGKLTEKKALAWFSYLDALQAARVAFVASRRDAFGATVARLTSAGFVVSRNDPKKYIKTVGAIICTVSVFDNGQTHNEYSVKYDAARDLFKF